MTLSQLAALMMGKEAPGSVKAPALLDIDLALAVFPGVVLARFTMVMRSMGRVPMRRMGVMSGLLMIARFVMLRRFPMMAGRMLVMLRSRMVVF